jgi:glycosyltransferase involved in cell wall biosynthesis
MKPGAQRPAICYAAPGQNLLSTSGSTRNVLSVAEAMSAWADVTVAFRSIVEPLEARSYRIVAIDERAAAAGARDDVAVRGLNPLAHARYLRTLRGFARRAAGAYDLVFEKGWRFSGYLACQCQGLGVASALIENDVRYWPEPIRSGRALVRQIAQSGTQVLARAYSRRLPLIIAETEELKEALVALRGIAPDRIEIVELGVDHGLFYPRDRDTARASLGISRDELVLLYVGGLDIYHDLGPIIEALAQIAPRSVALHVVGDGGLRSAYEETARSLRVRARFHGSCPHREVPEFIATADLCLAPYQPSRFYGGRITFSTLKIPEYMACARPVASVPQGHIVKLIEDQSNGFLLPNTVPGWATFLQALPSRARLEDMGRRAAERVEGCNWERTAAQYLEAARRLLETPTVIHDRQPRA